MIVLGAIYALSVPLLLYIATTPDVTQDEDAAAAIHGMHVGAMSCAILAVPTLLGGVKLLQRRRWAYWLVIANLGFCVASLTVGTLEESGVIWEALWVLLVFLAVFIFAVLPSTRRELDQQPFVPSA
jgi:hypothetical protein